MQMTRRSGVTDTGKTRTGSARTDASTGRPSQPFGPAQPTQPTRGLRVAATIAVVILAVHIFAMFLWIAPRNPLNQALDKPLRAYVLPMFQQSWSLFAPDPISAAYYLEVRALPQDLTETEWVSASDVELDGLLHNPLPSTATNITNKLATQFNDAFGKLPAEQQQIFTQGFAEDSWAEMGQQAISTSTSPSPDFTRALELDKAITGYATQFLKAHDLLPEGHLVQYRILRVAAPNFDDRHIAENTATISLSAGYRNQIVFDGQDEAAFARALENF